MAEVPTLIMPEWNSELSPVCDQTNHESLDHYLDGISHLPPAPTLMIKLIELFQRNDGDMDAVVTLIQRDPALATELIRRCNNLFLGDQAPTVEISEAVFQLGFYDVYRITIALFGAKMLASKNDMPDFPFDALRQHSSISAIAAGALAREVGGAEGIAFTAGLLHDVGKLVLGAAEGKKYVTLMRACQSNGTAPSLAEKEMFGFNHSEIGARLLKRWGVPDEVNLPVRWHHCEADSTHFDSSVFMVSLASHLANKLELPVEDFCNLAEVKSRMKTLGLDANQINRWRAVVLSELEGLPEQGAI
jgi:putative nucleotidyltransferase with HDIG domain